MFFRAIKWQTKPKICVCKSTDRKELCVRRYVRTSYVRVFVKFAFDNEIKSRYTWTYTQQYSRDIEYKMWIEQNRIYLWDVSVNTLNCWAITYAFICTSTSVSIRVNLFSFKLQPKCAATLCLVYTCTLCVCTMTSFKTAYIVPYVFRWTNSQRLNDDAHLFPFN